MRMKLFLSMIALMLVMFSLSGWIFHQKSVVKEGVVDLESWDFSKEGTVSLEGDWNFHWEKTDPGQISTNQPAFMNVPSTWDSQKRYPSQGYGLYHIQLKGLQVGESYGFKIPPMSNSYRLWLGDRLMVTNGIPGTTKPTTKPYYKPQELFFDAKSDVVDLYMMISNFHYRSGGMWSSLEFGTAEQITGLTKKNLAIETFLFGSLFLSGLYHIVLFVFRRKEKILLLFGITCLVISSRIIVIGEQIIVEFFPKIPWELLVKTEFITFYMVVPLFSCFLYTLYKEEVSKIFCKYLSIVSILFSILVLVTPAIIYTESIFLYQIVTITTIIYMIYALILAAIRKRVGAKVVLICATFYALTVINDILYINGNIDSMNLSSFGLFIFIFFQSYLIAKSTSIAFLKVEEYTNELANLNQTLEEKIYERTKSLEESTLELKRVNKVLKEMSYQDQLTGLPNRRYFDELYEKHWDEAVQNQTLLSILYLDIDHFKAYNDVYGHLQGDTTLRNVGVCLQQSIQKHDGTVARIGGEEFIALITNKTAEETNQIAEDCRNSVKALQIPHQNSSTSPYVTISIGVATIVPTHKDSKRKFIITADEALYYAKEEGRNQVVLSSV
jgi:diguanylate cyclase (GGDEF)-like protein